MPLDSKEIEDRGHSFHVANIPKTTLGDCDLNR